MNQTASSNFSPFEFETMRHSAASDLPPVAPNLEREAGMRLMREPANPRDRNLSPVAKRWVVGFPEPLQPHCLAQAYPRVANRLALCWVDPKLRDLLFADLLGGRRNGRQGFPPVVHAELMALRAFVKR
jgi:hypothetical protein